MAEAGPDAAPADAPAPALAPVVSLAEAREPAPHIHRRPDPLWFREVEVPGREVRAEDIPSNLGEVSSGLAMLGEWLYQKRETQASDLAWLLKRSVDRSMEELNELLRQPDAE